MVMGRFIAQVLGVVVATIIGRALVGLANILGYHPEVWLAFKMAQFYPSFSFTSALWIVAGVIALVVYVLEVRLNLVESVSFSKNILLRDAALFAYENTQGTTACRFAEHEDNPLNWYAIALIGQGEIPLFGVRSPLRKREKIPSNLLPQFSIIDDGASLKRYADNEPTYTNLEIKKKDMKKRIKEIATWGNDFG